MVKSPLESAIAIAIIAVFMVLMAFSLFLPAFVDEILFPLLTARAGYDGWQSISTFPQCGAAIPIPFLLLPGRALAWLAHAGAYDFFTLRAMAIFLAIAGMLFAAWFLKKCIFLHSSTLFLIAGTIAAAGLGTLPFILVLNRPETPMILAVVFYVFLGFYLYRQPSLSLRKTALLAVLFLLVTSWFLSAHFKALLYAPVVLTAAMYVYPKSKRAGLLLVLLTVGMLYQAWSGFWLPKMDCAGSVFVKRRIESVALSISLLEANPSLFIQQFSANTSRFAAYFPTFEKGIWLPGATATRLHDLVDGLVTAVFVLTVLQCIATLGFVGYRTIRRSQWTDPSLWFPIGLSIAVIAQFGLQSDKNFYTIGLIWASILLCGVALYSNAPVLRTYARLGKAVRFFFLLIALLSQCVLIATYFPSTLSSLRQATDQGLILHRNKKLISPLHYQERRQAILETARQCGIHPDGQAKHIGVDLFTYLPFKSTFQPFRVTFIPGEFSDSNRFLNFMDKHTSSGMVTLCHSLPQALRDIATRNGEICCLSYADFAAFRTAPH